ncbi:TetR/AcrR family transcriptional regulator [Tropicimonas sp. TH_r6]|uniref:TetR/AcrR family transcriptional regulator n=1 Tax=Tropicimonas sp. TH_r6 TaxID=3082085 RepID=UPI0029547B24|nr:TetR/AcrR family transcriptional regulator [Tropicimonas sp. TH_r6]MDV7144297.1 TetR/AcrR family transcriptional regulator [Tropicimonas sp. TH_r6]
METLEKRRLGREDWIEAALQILFERGVTGIKVVVLAERLGVTSGSFYWHFKKVKDLLDAVLNHWEHQLTDHIIRDAREFSGPAEERIFLLMKQVVQEGAAEPDHAIAVWSKSDPGVQAVFQRTLQRRYDFAAGMFGQAGFAEDEARVRGRILVAYLMGESSAGLKADRDWQVSLRRHWEVLVSRSV